MAFRAHRSDNLNIKLKIYNCISFYIFVINRQQNEKNVKAHPTTIQFIYPSNVSYRMLVCFPIIIVPANHRLLSRCKHIFQKEINMGWTLFTGFRFGMLTSKAVYNATSGNAWAGYIASQKLPFIIDCKAELLLSNALFISFVFEWNIEAIERYTYKVRFIIKSIKFHLAIVKIEINNVVLIQQKLERSL